MTVNTEKSAAANASARVILHVDMDAFFAAIEQLDNPALRGQAVIVGAAPNRRGVVCTCSYEARKFGVHSAMPSRTAYRLCPHGVFVPPRGERYEEVSQQLMRILASYSPLVEAVSIDEAFADMSGARRKWPDLHQLGNDLKQRLRHDLQLTGSVGIAPNKFLAKLASDFRKPDGLTVTPFDAEGIRAFLRPLPVGRLWGVGKVTGEQFERRGLRTVAQIQDLPEPELAALVGMAFAHHLKQLADGLDDRPVETEYEEKSISQETTFDEDCNDHGELQQTLLEQAEEVGRRLRHSGKLGRTAHIRIRFPDFRTITRQVPIRPPTASDHELIRCALSLFARENIRSPLRLIGFGVSNLYDPAREASTQPLLFDPDAESADSAPLPAADRRRLDAVVDDLRRRYGADILRRGRWHG